MSSQKVLIIDDSHDIHELVRVWLADEPAELHGCESGDEAVAMAHQLNPDLILLDVDLPGQDGFEICRRLKASRQTRQIPVIFLTGASSTEEKLRGLDLGAVDYIFKPFDPAELRARVRTSLNMRRLVELISEKAELRADVLQLIAQSRPLDDVLNRLVVAIESEEPNTFAGAMMVNGESCHTCAPRLPGELLLGMEEQLYRMLEPFGAASSDSQGRVVCCDVLNDPHWQKSVPAARLHGVSTCWYVPIRDAQRDVRGIVTLFTKQHVADEAPVVELLRLASDLISIALQHRQLSDQLKFQSSHDTLTRLPNRLMFAERLEQGLSLAKRSGKSLAVVVMDVDRFKHVNDTYGHQTGDELLCQVARRLERRFRRSDVVSRMGGDEFAAILFEMNSPEDAHLVAKSILDEFSQPLDLNGRKQVITLSIGSAVYPRDASDATALLKHADLALYRSKESGRNTARSFTNDMLDASTSRLEMEAELREAVAGDQLRLVYQPKVNPAGEIVGVEGLVRWHHPRLGIVPPMKFIPLAEDTGIIVKIGAWVLREAARQSRMWEAAGLGVVPIAVNVSTRQFAQDDFVDTVKQALAIRNSSERWLEVELTETLLMRNLRDAVDKSAQLREMNVTVAIDDFGTGYSSLAYLQRLSLDTLKVDRSFVRSIAAERGAEPAGRDAESSRIIIRAIVALAKSLRLSVVAEGIETDAQREFMLASGCDQLQGYLFSPPAPPEAIEKLLRQQTNLQTAARRLSA